MLARPGKKKCHSLVRRRSAIPYPVADLELHQKERGETQHQCIRGRASNNTRSTITPQILRRWAFQSSSGEDMDSIFTEGPAVWREEPYNQNRLCGRQWMDRKHWQMPENRTHQHGSPSKSTSGACTARLRYFTGVCLSMLGTLGARYRHSMSAGGFFHGP